MTPQPESSLRRQLLLGIFVVSGFTGLIYESIWSHYLKLFLGHAAYAQTLVLTIFMGGMAIGSWLVARYSGRIRRLLWGYVLVEGIIGLLGLVFHRGFVAITDVSFASVIPALAAPFAIHTYKWSLAALLILPQSILLGMTFPLISGGIIRRWPQQPGETLSMLYFTNSLGAAVGVLISGFVLIRAVGLPGTILTAGMLNIVLALCVWLLVRDQSEPAPQSDCVAPTRSAADRWFLIAAFFTGAASFLYEIGWIRMLSLVLGSSTHSFELMLSAFIFGLACGGLWMRRRIDRLQDPMRYLGIVMAVMGALALLTLPAYNYTFDFMAWALRALTRTEGGYTAFNVVSQGISMAIMLPTTFCAGMTLPLLTHALLKRGAGERAIGTVYGANTLGAIAGTLAAIHLLMPAVGVKGVVVSGAVIHIALGISGLMLARQAAPVLRLALSACCAALVVVTLFGVSLDPKRMTAAVYRGGQSRMPEDVVVRYLRDGKTATISLVEDDGFVMIATNGKPDATINMRAGQPAADEITMISAAALPLSLHPRPERVANIGFGSGLTSATLLLSDRVKSLESIEIEPFMVEAAKQGYHQRIHRVFDDPRSRIVFEDAKTFFAMAREPYDVIVSEPSNPWVSGVATLFSDEFYGRIVTYLKPDGLLVQWLQIYETDMSIVASILEAMSRHFGAYAVYNTDDSNIMIVATRGQVLPPLTDAAFDSPALRAELARVGIDSLDDIRKRRIGDRRTLGPLVASYGSPGNSDYFPFVDLNAPRLRFMSRSAIELPSLLIAPVPVVELLDASWMRSAAKAPSINSAIAADRLARKADLVRDAVISGKLEHLRHPVSTEVAAIHMHREQCADSDSRRAWLGAVQEIADQTTPYLSARQLDPMWNSVATTACYRESSETQKQWVELLAAVARRDAAAIVPSATPLLEQPDSTLLTDREYLVIALASAQLRLGDVERARAALASVPADSEQQAYRLPLRQLRALAESASGAAQAASNATSADARQ
jgi:predicted membrane-bound spermidine synthase